MAALKTSHKLSFTKFFQQLDPLSKFVFICLGLFSTGLLAFTLWRVAGRFTAPEIILAAGDKEGESYIISQAIEKVVESKSNIKITVRETGGTSQSLELLKTGQVQMAAAQADVASEEMDVSTRKTKPSKSEGANAGLRTVAVLYQDLFQLVVRNPKIKQFTQLQGKTVALPAKGGQYKSFQKITQHYGLTDIKIIEEGQQDYNDTTAEEDFKSRRADALFRVRAVGNKGISTLVQNYSGRLVAIPQAEAMKIKHPAFESTKIPQGAYRGSPAVPDEDLPTIAVSRLLVAGDTVEKSVVREITRIIFENRQAIADAVSPDHPEVKPLIANIKDPRESASVGLPPLHPGALAFYDRNQPSFVQENADYLALILTVLLLTLSWIRQIKSWMESHRKNEADEYIQSAINLMKANSGNLENNQKQLDEIFKKAADALIDEKISQESFRTFNEAYKTSREAIERERAFNQEQIEHKQRELSASYIKAIVELLRNNNGSKDILQEKVDTILKEVAEKLVSEEISQESFRTFIEAYKTTKDAIERY
ncbi:TAXI family TRAP transporter solute-binding subunit [Scytonema sp. UIC 10036]|uniref:TAXI family TRAP transporter solute-binding subunit n=1 Tax=Scytonema sp. UIC 10036 TaxID=2304196 RepID=UPI0012DA89A7|nr:TAXI family TRAP transporter solute-binding subunit [Scytonema sp. UIC 10036]MUG96792.1 TAXI family TRAP transporter solute-binding subunit [Scytonema sp. UIC 10036]